jgi:hypothetical protein
VEKAMKEVLSGERQAAPGMRDPSLSPLEQQRFDELAALLRAGQLNADDDLWRLDYLAKPPDMEQIL